MLHTSYATQIQQIQQCITKPEICVAKPGFCVAKPGFCVANCDAIPSKLCLVLSWQPLVQVCTLTAMCCQCKIGVVDRAPTRGTYHRSAVRIANQLQCHLPSKFPVAGAARLIQSHIYIQNGVSCAPRTFTILLCTPNTTRYVKFSVSTVGGSVTPMGGSERVLRWMVVILAVWLAEH